MNTGIKQITVLACVAFAGGLWAETTTKKVISFNWTDQDGARATDSSGVFNVSAVAWNNLTTASNDDGLTLLNLWTGDASVNDGIDSSETLRIIWNASGFWGCSATDPIQQRYLDDGKATTITVSNIPYAAYDVYIITSTDQGDGGTFKPWTVNGNEYGSPSWGDSTVRDALTENANFLKIEKQSGTLTIVGNGRGGAVRGCISALQIVEATVSQLDVDGGDAYATTDLPTGADIVNLSMNADGVLTVSGAMSVNVKVTCPGNLTIAAGEGYSPTAADLAALDLTAVAGSKVTYRGLAVDPSAPAADKTVRIEDTTTRTVFPYAASGFAGTVELACPVTVEGQVSQFGTKGYVFEDGARISVGILTLGNQGGVTQTYVQKGGSVVVTSDNAATTTSAAMLLGHWGGGANATYTVNGGSLSVPNAPIRLGWDGTGVLVVNGGTVTTKGFRGGANDGHGGAGTLNLAGGTVNVTGDTGIQFGSAGTVTLGGATVAFAETASVTAGLGVTVSAASTIDVAAEKTLTLDADLSGAGDLIKTGDGILAFARNPVGYTGTIRLSGGALDVRGNRALPAVVFAEGTKLIAREVTADDGVIRIEGISGDPAVELYDALGNAIEASAIERGEGYIQATIAPTVSGEGCWMDYEFNGDRASVGTDKTALSRDGSDFGSDPALDFADDTALYTGTHPYRSVSYPAEWSCAISGTVPDYPKAALITFGTLNGGLIGLICGEEKDQVLLVRTTGNSRYTVLATMAVPNAATANHLYVFSKTARQIKVYLDGKLWTTYNADADISFGGGMQIASVHGGTQNTGIVRFDKNLFTNDGGVTNATLRKSTIDMMRLYNAVIGPNAAAALSEEFPYVSPNGLFTRTVNGAANWNESSTWTKVQTGDNPTADRPDDGAMVKITAAGESTLTVNLDATVTTEELSVDGPGPLAVARSGYGKVANSGATTVATALTIQYGALDIAGGPLTLEEGGSVCFDFSSFSFASVTSPTTITLTGLTGDLGDKVTCSLPADLNGRTAAFAYDGASSSYRLTIGMAREPGMVYTPQGATYTLSNSSTFVNAAGEPDELFFEEDWIAVNCEQTITVAENLTRPAKIMVVEGGVLKLAFAAGVTQTDFTYPVTVKVCDGGVYDINGRANGSHPIILAGGTLTNGGDAISVGLRQYWQNTVESDSTIAVPANEYGCVNSDWAQHDYNLNGHKVTKTGPGTYTFRTANFVGGGTIEVAEGKLILNSCVIPEGANLNFVVAEGAILEFVLTTPAKTGTITGSGTVIYAQGVPTSDIFQDEGWWGTVWIKNMTWNSWDLGRDGNESSKVQLTGVKGYSPASGGCNAEVVMVDAEEDGVFKRALLAVNGMSNGTYFFRKISGSGTFGWDIWDESITAGPTGGHIYWLKDVSDYTGQLVTGDYLHFKVGEPAADGRTPGEITVADGATVCPGNWLAKTITFGETLNVKGRKGDVLATVTNEPTFGKVKVTMLTADGVPVPAQFLLKTRAVENGFEVYVDQTGFAIHVQ